jgi:hypothetical protein
MRSRIFTSSTLSAYLGLFAACEQQNDSDTQAGNESESEGYDVCSMGLDALIPSDCRCVDEGAPCYQSCFVPDDMLSCDQVCAEVGETCVENGCSDGTYLLGSSSGVCPMPSEYGPTELLGCSEAVPADGSGAACCCTQS